METAYVVYYKSSLGPMRIEANSNGIYKIDLLEPHSVEKYKDSLTQIDELPDCHVAIKNNLKKCIEWLTAYFSGNFVTLQERDTIPVLDKTDHSLFATKVWNYLEENVPPGQTISYGKVAELVGSKGGSQAVGQIMKHNRLSLILPCHRVIRSDGSLGHYSSCGGTKTKEWLLKHEKCLL